MPSCTGFKLCFQPMQGKKMRVSFGRALAASLLGLLFLAGCSSSFGGGDPPEKSTTIVVPPGSTVVCPGGGAPPC